MLSYLLSIFTADCLSCTVKMTGVETILVAVCMHMTCQAMPCTSVSMHAGGTRRRSVRNYALLVNSGSQIQYWVVKTLQYVLSTFELFLALLASMVN